MKQRKPRRLPKSVRPEEFKLLIKAVPKKDKEALVGFLLAYGSGLRLSEVTNLKKENLRESSIEIIQGKGGVDRIVPLAKGWKQWMREVLPIKKTGRSL